ncbi:uncharacterized protein LOC100680211 [Nasonia vitripennis]|uniref:Uncharacterized protein n=1 Tax=Nasonia vitripennis TaxID=7425 RepID=A0A7M7GHF0_NASVI|nr:uncharacterized protein LOC100680211 [Nasonia vitripennis]
MWQRRGSAFFERATPRQRLFSLFLLAYGVSECEKDGGKNATSCGSAILHVYSARALPLCPAKPSSASRSRERMASTKTTTSAEEELDRRRAEEYQMQLFGLHSRTVFALIKQKINENVETRCKKIYSSIEKKYKPDAKGTETLKNNIRHLRRAYQRNMQPHLTAIESVVNKFISVPNNVLLEEDKGQAKQYTDDEFQNLERRLENLQQQAQRVTVFNAALKEELENTENIKESEEAARTLCKIIDKGLSAKKLSSKTTRAIEHRKGLFESLDSLKPQTDKDIYNPRLKESDCDQIIL